jgi:hypothetical protein
VCFLAGHPCNRQPHCGPDNPLNLFGSFQFWAGRGVPLRAGYLLTIVGNGLQLGFIIWVLSGPISNPGLRGELQYTWLAVYARTLTLLAIFLLSGGSRRFVWDKQPERN